MSNLKTYFKKSVSVCKKSSAYIRAIPVLQKHLNPEKPDVPLNKNDAFQKVQKRRVQEKR